MPTASRPYRSPLREEQARATRRSVVEAARDLFVERGFAGTTIDAVAERAGVSRKTVFTAVGGKVALLKLAWDWALVGDDEPVPMAERPQVMAMMRETDQVQLVRLWARFAAEVAGRIASLHPVLEAAADADAQGAELAAVSERNRAGGARSFVDGLAEIGGLRPDIDPDRAAEIATVLMDPMPYTRLVTRGGWTHDEYVAWLTRMAEASFLPVPPTHTA
jgi:AcrR family transcriptional regulator